MPCNYQSQNLRQKGESLFMFPDNYTVIDIETTGFSPHKDKIIELSAIKVVNREIKETFSSLVMPVDDYEDFVPVKKQITNLTGITNEMLSMASLPAEVLPKFLRFVGNDIVVGHNVNFDINFIYDNTEKFFRQIFDNDFCDLLRISREFFPNFEDHKLQTVAQEFGIPQEQAHRGLADCETTYKCFEHCRKYAIENNIFLPDENVSVAKKTKIYEPLNAKKPWKQGVVMPIKTCKYCKSTMPAFKNICPSCKKANIPLLGFRTRKPWKMVIAALYYIVSLLMITEGLYLMFFMLSIPLIVFGLFETIKYKAPSLLIIGILMFLLSFTVLSPEETPNNSQDVATNSSQTISSDANDIISDTKADINTTEINDVSSENKVNNIPTEYKSALRKAKSYSDTMHMSKAGLYEQLTSEYGEQFSAEAAQYAIDNLDADYKANALAKAKTYQDAMSMSPAAIYDQLISEYGEQFTAEEAQYAIDNLK